MSKLSVLEIPHPILLEKAQPVAEVTPEIQQLLADMLETMYATNGVGLAGNQVGELKRIVVMDCADANSQPDPIKMVNPQIVWKSEEMICGSEGCLSVPKQYADVTRHASVEVVYLDENGKECRRRATGLLAVCMQHEIDHLDGILFIDYLSSLKRKMLIRSLEKRRRKAVKEQEN